MTSMQAWQEGAATQEASLLVVFFGHQVSIFRLKGLTFTGCTWQ
jgi:hypothetical protein